MLKFLFRLETARLLISPIGILVIITGYLISGPVIAWASQHWVTLMFCFVPVEFAFSAINSTTRRS